MTWLQIVLNIPLNQTFTYSYIPSDSDSKEFLPEIGKRAEVRFQFLTTCRKTAQLRKKRYVQLQRLLTPNLFLMKKFLNLPVG